MGEQIRRTSPIPLYRQLADILKRRIQAGEFEVDHPIPSELELMAEYDLGRDAVRHAVAALRAEGVVYTVPRRGTYVRGPESPVDSTS